MGALSRSNHKSSQEASVVDIAGVVGGGVVVVVVVVVAVVVVMPFILSILILCMRISRRRRKRSFWGAAAAPVLSTLTRLFVFPGVLVTSLGLFPLWLMICWIRAQLDLVRVKLQGVALAS